MAIQIARASMALGAEVSGVDVTKPISDAEFESIHAAYLEYGLVLIRNQQMGRKALVELGTRFGEICDYREERQTRASTHPSDYPEVSLIIHEPEADVDGDSRATKAQAAFWHTDRSHMPDGSGASLLSAVQIPPVGGDTIFANMYWAYETLSPGMQKLLDGLRAVYLHEQPVPTSSDPEALRLARVNCATSHPAVRVHPETGRKSLFVCAETEFFDGMSTAESEVLITYLTEWATQPQNVYRHTWRQGNLVIFDNRCLTHAAVGNYSSTDRRHMERITVAGPPTGEVYLGPIELGAHSKRRSPDHSQAVESLQSAPIAS